MARQKKTNGNDNGKTLTTQQGMNQYVKNICDIMRRSNCAGALQYVPELTWILFLRILDEREHIEAEEAEAVGIDFITSLSKPFRWQDWAAPEGEKRKELQEGALGAFFGFIHGELLPYLKKLKDLPNATPRQKVISEVLSGVDRVRIDTERNMLEVLDRVNEITVNAIDDTHIFALSQIYEGLLLKMGEKGNDGGQFFTPREIIRTLVKIVNPKIGETVYDPCCGTGGFLAQAYEYMRSSVADDLTPDQLEALKQHTFFGREKENLIYPIALANLVLHGIDHPHLWHGNTLTGSEQYGGLYENAPGQFNVILTNPPFGGKEGADAQTNFNYKTSATQVLFLQHVLDSLKPGGRCGIVVDEGVLFRTNEQAFVQTKRKLIEEFNLWCIISLPGGVFTTAGAGVKTNLLFFNKEEKTTEKIWYYDLSHIKVTKKNPFVKEYFDEFFKLMPERADSEYSWSVSREEIEKKNFDLKAVNPNAKTGGDSRTPEELLDIIEQKGREISELLALLRK
ncbi:N-6 DNA methylase [Heliobacterium undosum]|uniref:site-specific DNA-methyltransferase (adenine-specific) n=1 Tax=Heliomicrobium undosum TaxID=121734 RepID=A0A845KY54_9FIRM|nr:N-6 DNA methylase [Heliomicrobium undosum]MZP28707.1 N-6 DNA methylase [Heliomicrobium undosum]